ncbi:MAG TPA: hypothetical protein VL426_03555 [Candidatus Binatia bacterium]|nr:hypothetical protein [Candidatus Binatia bacterium]
MILFIDLRNDRHDFAAVDAKRTKWLTTPAASSSSGPLAKALKAFGMPKRKPSAVAVAMGGEPGKRDVSWSAVRAGVAAANALALAWNVPAVAVAVAGDESRLALEDMVRKVAKGAASGAWVPAKYSGEPTITQAKPLL